MTVAELSDHQVAERLALLRGDSVEGGEENQPISAVGAGPAPLSTDVDVAGFRFVRPLSDAAGNLVEYLQNSEGRFMFGLPELDLMTRGIGPGELAYITGFTHSGKTQVFLTACVNNRTRRVLLITMDETAEQVLTKLICMRTGSNAERLEERIKAGDRDAVDRVNRIAKIDFKNLLVVDGGMRIDDLSTVVREAEEYWGAPVDVLCLDYLELLKTDDSNLEGKSQSLKTWAVEQHFPVLCIHQGSRGNAGGGQKLSLNSMKYAGEAEATFVIGVRRLRDDPDLAGDPGVQDTVEVALIKNKRPPSRTGEYSYLLAPDSGLVLPLSHRPEEPSGLAAVRRSQLSPGQRNFDNEEEVP